MSFSTPTAGDGSGCAALEPGHLTLERPSDAPTLAEPSSSITAIITLNKAAPPAAERYDFSTIGAQQTCHVIFPIKVDELHDMIEDGTGTVDARKLAIGYATPTYIWYYSQAPASEIRYIAKVGDVQVVTGPKDPARLRARPKVESFFTIEQLWELTEPLSIGYLKTHGYRTVSKWGWAEDWMVKGVTVEKVAKQVF